MSGVSHLNPHQYGRRVASSYDDPDMTDDDTYNDYTVPLVYDENSDDLVYDAIEAERRLQKGDCRRRCIVVAISIFFWMLNVGGSLALIYKQFIM